ncbi:MAG: hypothetical protein JEZ02_14575 [Desulfatibacillum sp.]|nr:hypothetical protein [Desulfatibacillum sp.]
MAELRPAYDFDDSRNSTLLFRGTAEIGIGDSSYSGEGEAWLDLFPKARLCFTGSFQNVPLEDYLEIFSRQTDMSHFSIGDCQIEGLAISGNRQNSSDNTSFKCFPKSEPIVGVGRPSTAMSRVVFHLFDFRPYIGVRRLPFPDGDKVEFIDCLDFNSEEWAIIIQSLPETRKRFDTVREDGAHQLTHVGCFKKKDGSDFCGDESNDVIDALRYFLSLAEGKWCEPVCAKGFDNSGESVWEHWSSPREHWRYSDSWFDQNHGCQLEELFPLFMEKWGQAGWRDAFREAIYWYLVANDASRGVDAGLILTQTAIERLSYEFSVNEESTVSRAGFQKSKASEKFRLLFSPKNIPLNVPSDSLKLQGLIQDQQWEDSPHALTAIRNSIIHPENRHYGEFESAYSEAWNLSQWYLEMSILAICGYSGTYSNRLKRGGWVGEVEDVPWA